MPLCLLTRSSWIIQAMMSKKKDDLGGSVRFCSLLFFWVDELKGSFHLILHFLAHELPKCWASGIFQGDILIWPRPWTVIMYYYSLSSLQDRLLSFMMFGINHLDCIRTRISSQRISRLHFWLSCTGWEAAHTTSTHRLRIICWHVCKPRMGWNEGWESIELERRW